jgi:lipoate-protein ligase A
MEAWYLLIDPPAPAAWNMALDEALLRTAGQRGRPLLRIYRWDRPSVTFGYFQKLPAYLTGNQVLMRRPTGGGIVYHGEDTTYTVVAPPGHRLHKLPTQEAYCLLHQAVSAALALQSQIADRKSTPRGQYECFQNPVAGDVVGGGRKLAGGAQRRGKSGVLHQGSIATHVAPSQLADGFRRVLLADFQPYELTTTERALAEELVRTKYATEAWNRRTV